MVVIVGLGNPPGKYKGTRHNAGHLVIDELASLLGAENKWTNKDHRQELKTKVGGVSVVLVKPTEFMNSSGQGVRAVADFYRVPATNIWVVYDDVNVDLGAIRIRQVGSSGGHNGVKSIIDHLDTGDFPRVRVGIGPLPEGTSPQGNVDDNELSDFVLGRFNKSERKTINKVATFVAELLREAIIQGGLKDTTTRV